MQKPDEYNMVERPIIDHLEELGYFHLTGEAVDEIREDKHAVILKSIFIESVKKLNNIDTDEANRLYMQFIRTTDNEECLNLIRGKKSVKFSGEKQSEPVKYINFSSPEKNIFTVVNQLKIHGVKNCIPDVIVYVNGIPLVVIECKGPIANQDIYTGIKQIHEYERNIPKLFQTNMFNISTDGIKTLYGATDSGSKYYLEFKDPYPKKVDDFKSSLEMACYCLLDKERLLDLVYNYVLFEVRDKKKTKKICRYQQFRAVKKIVDRVVDGEKKKGLIWHTQGSGKSLTMFYAAYKLKMTEKLQNPNIIIITDRVDLDDQISKTFVACGFRNPIQFESIKDLKEKMSGVSKGQTFLTTIHKFEEFEIDDKLDNSDSFIVFVDECHRTQEGDLGSKLRNLLGDSFYFGFTGTPIKKKDKNTYENFGEPGEKYLDKYGIEDAIRDNVTVPIYYENHTACWNLKAESLDILYDETFRELTDEQKEELKKRESRVKNIIKNKSRIELVAYHIATHYKQHVLPNGFKAQLVAIDREAIILYKKELNKYFEDDEVRCVYSKAQHDDKDFEKYYADKSKEKEIKEDFKDINGKTKIIIVCDKLLTGFDAPIEQAMYLDSSLKEHNLLQAIARTNRVYANKVNGLIIDYFGVSSNLSKALSNYIKEDVENAMRDLKELKEKLRAAHKDVMNIFKGVVKGREDIYDEITNASKVISSKDVWYNFKKKFKIFNNLYETISPDAVILKYKDDLKWLSAVHAQCKVKYEPLDKSIDYKEYGQKVKEMIDEYLQVTGLKKVFDIKDVLDPDFFDIDKTLTPEQNALKKSASLQRVLEIRIEQNPIVFRKFSEYLKNVIDKYADDVENSKEYMQELDKLAKLINDEDDSMEDEGLNKNAKSFYKLLEEKSSYDIDKNGLIEKAMEIDEIFEKNPDACFEWQKKDDAIRQLKRLIKRATINIIDDKEGFANEIINYAKVNYYKG